MTFARLEVVTYAQVHWRLSVDRGPATGYPCVECAGQAREWAYLGGDPAELKSSEHGCAYSLDQSFYVAMCWTCHKRHDHAVADGRSVDVCPQGHAWADNAGYRNEPTASGIRKRYCRACNREGTARLRLAARDAARLASVH